MPRSDPPTVGVLALQGDVREHLAVLTRLGAQAVRVRRPDELALIDGIVIPGGESSVIDKLTRIFGMREPLIDAIGAGMPVYGTCAGLIMLARNILDGIEGQRSLSVLDVDVRRNAFGSQVDSFEADLDVPALGTPPVHAVFIRAPVVERTGPHVEVLATLDDGRIVAVREGHVLATSFHPEMDDETRFHELLLQSVREAGARTSQ